MQQALKRRYFAMQIRSGHFDTNEPEYELSRELLSKGDWVLDVGANIGQYTLHFSHLVGTGGRVIAFEPVAETFELLAANVCCARVANVTLVNAAASDGARLVGMHIPKFETGLENFYEARVSATANDVNVLCVKIDSLALPHAVRLVKIDAEGHDLQVLLGMRQLLARDRPVLFVEDDSDELKALLRELGYSARRLPSSSNTIYEARTLAS